MIVVAPISVSEGESQWDYPPIDRYIPSAEQIAHALAGGRLEHELDRLKRLGVTAVELMPVADFPGAHNWGYDGVLPYAPDEAYGTPDGFKAMVP